MKQERKIIVPISIKALTEDGLFSGYAGVFGNKDSEGDIIVKGAFKRTIDNKKGKWPILWQHDYRQPVGANRTAEEDDHGLKVEGKLFTDMPNGKNAYAWMKNAMEEGLQVGLSIGFRIIDKTIDNGIRYLKEIALMEYSIVTFPANEMAQVTSVKAAVPFQDLPLASDTRSWSASAATKRVFTWAGGDENINWEKYRKAFLIFDEAAPDKKGSYKLPIADVISGKLTAVPKGISAAAGRLDQTDASASDKTSAKGHLEKYYRKMNKPSPFKADNFEDGSVTLKAMDFTTALQQEMNERELRELRWTIESALCDAERSVCDDESMTSDEKLGMLETIYDQYGKAIVAWYAKYFAMEDEEAPETNDVPSADPQGTDTTKMYGLSNLNKRVLKAAKALHSQAITMHREAGRMHSQGTAMVDSVLKGYAEQFDPDAEPTQTDRSTQTPSPNQKQVEDNKELVAAIDNAWKRAKSA